MRLSGETITLYNARLDQEQDCTVYEKTVIHGVSWYGSVQTAIGDSGLKSANVFTVRIPADADFGGKEYCDAGSYTEAGDVSRLFTLKPGDLIVKGVVPDSAGTPAQIHKKYPEVSFTIKGVTDNNRAPNAKHWKVVGA